MDFTAYTHRLLPRRIARLTDAVAKLETAISTGIVPNTLFNDAKDTINRAVSEAVDHYQNETRDYSGKLITSAHDLVAGVKQATAKDEARLSLLVALSPLNGLLLAAKPLIRKKGDLPKVKTQKQIADEADQMTCQCCGRGIFAATGLIAHHGYERPGHGWQTASCYGARHLPWEVSRDALGELINLLKARITNLVAARQAVSDETSEVTRHYTVSVKTGSFGYSKRVSRSVEITRASFSTIKARVPEAFEDCPRSTFDDFKAQDVASRNTTISQTREHLKFCEARFADWKQTHQRVGDKWEAL